MRLGDGSRTHPRLDKGQGPPGPRLALGQINPKNRVTTSKFITYGAADLSSVTGKPSTGVVLVNVFLTLTAPGLCTDRELTACRPLCWGVTQGSAFVPDALTRWQRLADFRDARMTISEELTWGKNQLWKIRSERSLAKLRCDGVTVCTPSRSGDRPPLLCDCAAFRLILL